MKQGGLAAVLLLCGLVGCRIAPVEPTPLSGEAPASVVVAPPVDHTGQPHLDDTILLGADTALRGRGYRVLPLAVGSDLLRRRGLLLADGGVDLAGVRRELDVEAVLQVEVYGFEVVGGRTLERARYELEWRLLATATGAELWRHRLSGEYRRPTHEPFDPTHAMGEEEPPLPFGVTADRPFRDAGELAAALHRAAMEHLPRRPR